MKSLLTICRWNHFRYVADVTHDVDWNRSKTLSDNFLVEMNQI